MSTTPLRITGVVVKRARTAVDTSGRAWLLVDIDQGAVGGVLCRVRRDFGVGHNAQYAASQAAHRMQRGAQITVYAPPSPSKPSAARTWCWPTPISSS